MQRSPFKCIKPVLLEDYFDSYEGLHENEQGRPLGYNELYETPKILPSICDFGQFLDGPRYPWPVFFQLSFKAGDYDLKGWKCI